MKLKFLLAFVMGCFLAYGQNTLEFSKITGDANPTGNGPVVSTAINFVNNTTGNTFAVYNNPGLTATFTLTNQPYDTSQVSSPAGSVLFGATASGAGQGIFLNGDTGWSGGSVNGDFTSVNSTAGNGISRADNYAVTMLNFVRPMGDGFNRRAKIYNGRLEIVFSRPVSNPIIHVSGLGGNSADPIYFSNTLDLNTAQSVPNSGIKLTRLSGDNNFVISSGTSISNSATTPAVASNNTWHASGSVRINGTNIQKVSFDVYIQGHSANPNTTGFFGAATDGDAVGISLSVSDPNIVATNDSFGSLISGSTTSTSVLANDTYNGVAATTSNVTLSATGLPTGLTLNSNGTVSIASNVASGDYSFVYTICDATNGSPCRTATATLRVERDSDGDGVIDSIDLDDDNDGILDTDEGCTATVTMGTISNTNVTNLINNNTTVVPISGVTLPNGGVRLTKTAGTGNSWATFTPGGAGSTTTMTVNGVQSSSFPTTYLDLTGTIPRTLNINFGTTANALSTANNQYQFVIGIAGLGGEGTVVNNTFSVPLTVASNANVFNTNLYSLLDGVVSTTPGVSGTVFRTNTPAGTAQGYTFFLVPMDVASFTMTWTGANDPHGMIFGVYNANCSTDTDGDGTPNYLDLDSDGDGCFDAIEGDENVKRTNVDNNGRITGGVNANGVPNLVNSNGAADVGGDVGQGIGDSRNASVSQCIDTDGDGIYDMDDLDDDNDGVLDIDECRTSVVSTNFSTSNGTTTTFSAPAADLGFIFDVYTLDNSFNMTVNGVAITSAEIDFQSNHTSKNIRFIDGNTHGNGTVPEIWQMTGTATTPILRLTIHQNGTITILGSKVAGGPLFPMQLYNGTTFNTINWNNVGTNTFVISQSVDNATYISGNGSGYKKGFCDPDGDGVSNDLDLDSDGDGCFDAIEGDENVYPSQLNTNGSINATDNGGFNSSGVPNLVNAGGAADLIGTMGQGIGSSQDNTVNGCYCYKPGVTSGTVLTTNQGITSLQRAGSVGDNWPMVRNGGWTALEALTKGFVVNRLTNAQIAAIPTANLIEGMMVYSTTDDCLKINTDGTAAGWKCFNQQACTDF